ncbi:PAS domain-containing protein [Ancylobacter amanitiformis]|uniref:PAS domain S-box-containing protein n=1 Tax=Ancylobacter amanitiformis TaxID=217069 RepID=A0ABU0LNV7_9HYPH|nr:PAS domain-containing protein [Ancylobacter amanitiformis]MDQ0510387.1 PAS domain S-box-containing protein [Ancylobacter amanitiformis]
MRTEVDCAQLVAAIGDAVVVSDAEGRITLWNAAATAMFGFGEDEALGQSLDLIIPERLRKRHWDGYDETMRSGVTKYGTQLLRVPAVHKDGRALSIAFTVALLTDEANAAHAIVAVIRDETVRWTEERDLRRRLAECEARVSETKS